VAVQQGAHLLFCESGAHKILDVDSLPLTPDQQVQIGRERLDAVSEPLDKVFRLTSRGLAGMFLAR
jgi:hypothetical protein